MCCYGNYWNVKVLKEEEMLLEEIAIEEVVIEVEKSN
jgi:hypothetical protein